MGKRHEGAIGGDLGMFKNFKKWLIHKLGGTCYDDFVQPVIIKQNKKVEKLTAEMLFDRTLPTPPQDYINRMLVDKLVNGLEPYIAFTDVEGERSYDKFKRFRAEVEVVVK